MVTSKQLYERNQNKTKNIAKTMLSDKLLTNSHVWYSKECTQAGDLETIIGAKTKPNIR